MGRASANVGARRGALDGAVVALGVLVFAVHARLYAAWLVDDAGISIAYARNLVHGAGLVAQPGAAPVEGYSDPAWVALLAALEAAHALVLPVAPKLLGLALVTGAYVLLARLARSAARLSLAVAAATVVFSSLNPSFVAWCTSGLENALYIFSVALLAWLTNRALATRDDPVRLGRAMARCGAAAVLVAWTRPDGVLFAILPPLVALPWPRPPRAPLVRYLAAFALPYGGLLVLRLAVFHALVPNTYFAKGGVRVAEAVGVLLLRPYALDKIHGVLGAAVGEAGANFAVVLALVAAILAARRGAFGRQLAAVWGFALVALAGFMLLPADRLGEWRFATPFFPFFYLALFSTLVAAIDATATWRAAPLAACAAVLAASCLPPFAGRALVLARRPPVGLFYVKRAFSDRIGRYADALHVERGSVLLPDVGALLLWSPLRVIDLAGLCDRDIARTLFHDPSATREHVFGAVRPTFIHAADVWAKTIALDEDARFAADYTPVFTYDAGEDPAAEGHASGLFVRKDAVAPGDLPVLDALRHEPHDRLRFLPPPAPSALLAWLDDSALVPDAYRRAAAKTR